MVFVDKSFVDMLTEIEFRRRVRHDILIPDERPDVFVPAPEDRSMTLVSREYIKTLGEFAARNFYALWELYINAQHKGNKSNPNLPIVTKLFEGSKGTVIRIEDSGEGFPYKDFISAMRSGNPIFEGEGKGLRYNERSKDLVSYEGDGNIVNVMSPLGI
jgi:hypothetical protein